LDDAGALARAYDLTGNPKFLNKAKTIFAGIQAAWDTSCCGAVKGGIWWNTAHTHKATASNAGPALAATRLYQETQLPEYLSFAIQVYSFWRANMVNPQTYQVSDHIDTDGAVAKWKFTYNEGLMIGAAVELYEVTKQAAYLADAHHIAAFMIGSETETTSYGPVLHDGSNSGCAGDCQQFKGIGYRYLMALYQLDASHAEYWKVLRASADAMWNLASAPSGLYSTPLFASDWGGPAPSGTLLIDAESSAAMGLSVFAHALGGYSPAPPKLHYEAEDGVLHGLGLEASHAGFSGWGYVAGWNSNGQSVDFRVNAPSAGTYTLTLHYAAGAGNAYRNIALDGNPVQAHQLLAGTGSWGSYRAATLKVTLPAGKSTISVSYDAAAPSNSSNHLNLDAIDLALTQ
jgi:glycosyl hydrolase family 76/carbohydrate binding protein with CBM35 domain